MVYGEALETSSVGVKAYTTGLPVSASLVEPSLTAPSISNFSNNPIQDQDWVIFNCNDISMMRNQDMLSRVVKVRCIDVIET